MGYSPWSLKESDMTEQLTHTHRQTQTHEKQNVCVIYGSILCLETVHPTF